MNERGREAVSSGECLVGGGGGGAGAGREKERGESEEPVVAAYFTELSL